MGDRKGRPYAGLVAELFGCGGDACRRRGMGDREGRPYAGLVAELFGV